MKTLYLNINENTIVPFEKSQKFHKIKINKLIIFLDYKNLKEKAHIKTGTSR